jgi:hypothetical protein
MRILEKCTSSWPMPDMQRQIDALREAFSANVRKPFVLKPSFPYGSPGAPVGHSPVSNKPYRQINQSSLALDQQNMEHHNAQQKVSYTNHPISPPISTGGVDTKDDSPAVQSLGMMAAGQRPTQQPITSGVSMEIPPSWNPTRIFE